MKVETNHMQDPDKTYPSIGFGNLGTYFDTKNSVINEIEVITFIFLYSLRLIRTISFDNINDIRRNIVQQDTKVDRFIKN